MGTLSFHGMYNASLIIKANCSHSALIFLPSQMNLAEGRMNRGSCGFYLAQAAGPIFSKDSSCLKVEERPNMSFLGQCFFLRRFGYTKMSAEVFCCCLSLCRSNIFLPHPSRHSIKVNLVPGSNNLL